MSNLTMKGTIIKVCEVETGVSKANKEWQKQTFVINNGDEYNPEVAFSVFGNDKIEALGKFAEGQSVEVAFNLSSREFNSKYYHNIDAWKVTEVEGAEQPAVDAELGDIDPDLGF